MGVKLGDLVPPTALEETELSFFKNKSIAIDAYNILYQFITIIRGQDGRPLMNRHGMVTSHLSGLFFRTVNFLAEGMRPVYVFDGRPPELKRGTLELRSKMRREADEQYERAIVVGDVEAARKYAVRAATLEEYMVRTSRELLDALGVPYVQAPSEGEAQAAYMAMRGDVWASASQDYDSLLFGSPRLVRNLSIIGRRKLPGRKQYVEVKPEVVYLDRLLSTLGIKREDLVEMAMLIGTDYCEGVKGIGPKRAYSLVKQHGSVEAVLAALGATLDCDILAVRRAFLHPSVSDNYRIEWREPDVGAVKEFLCGEHDFSEERVEKALKELEEKARTTQGETRLDEWI